MPETTDIEALVAEAEDTAKQIYAEYGDIHASNVMERLAVALEAQQAVVEAMRTIKDREGKVCDAYESCSHPACQSSYNAWAIADAALAALDAKLGEDG